MPITRPWGWGIGYLAMLHWIVLYRDPICMYLSTCLSKPTLDIGYLAFIFSMVCCKGFPHIVIRTQTEQVKYSLLTCVFALLIYLLHSPASRSYRSLGYHYCGHWSLSKWSWESMMTYLFGCTCLLFWAMSSKIIHGLFDKSDSYIIEK